MDTPDLLSDYNHSRSVLEAGQVGSLREVGVTTTTFAKSARRPTIILAEQNLRDAAAIDFGIDTCS